jgi:signal peptidase II
MKYLKYYLLTLAVIVLDQTVKMLVHFNMGLHTEIPVIGNWFKIHYTLNPGMAFGLELGSSYGKLFLSVFRLGAMVAIGWYLYSLAKRQAPAGLLWCMGLILGGAIGNVIDSVFYGVLLHNAPQDAPTPWFHGQVIDMIYFDLWTGRLPDWLPLWGGEYTSMYPIFNVADASIFIGVATILLFQKRFFRDKKGDLPVYLSPETHATPPPHPVDEVNPSVPQ